MKKISILIPVYKYPKYTNDILKKLFNNNYENKEIIVIVDGVNNNDIENAIKEYKDKITIIYNNERLGKVNSLNKGVKYTSEDSEILFFLDNDVILPDNKEYLKILADDMENHDLAEIPKEAIINSFLSSIMYYEFLTFSMATYTIAKLSKRSPAMNGAAFAIKKELFLKLGGFRNVLNEDMDLAARAFKIHARFSYNKNLKILNEVPSNLKEWLKQRKRWALDNILWLQQHFDIVFPGLLKYPAMFFASILLFFPFICYFLAYLLLKKINLMPILSGVFLVFMQFHFSAGILFMLTHYESFFKGIIPTLIGLFTAMAIYFSFSLFYKAKFNPFTFIIYYFIYSPIWLLSNIIMGITVLLKIEVDLDWKV